jgi:hypothetical protein
MEFNNLFNIFFRLFASFSQHVIFATLFAKRAVQEDKR